MARLLFASIGLDERRFWDERYSLENVRHTLESGSLRPVSGWYPAPSYLPHTALLAASDALHRVTGWERFAVFRDGGFSPGAYFLCRSLQAVFGALSLLLLFLLGRRLGDWRVGLLAALLLAVTPNHLRLSVFFKPDVLLLCATLVAVLLSLRLLGEARGVDFVLAGVAVALAASAKLPGVVAAVPVVVATLAGGWLERRRLLGLAAAGAVSVTLFLVLNPHWALYLEYFERQQRQYAERAVETTQLGMLAAELRSLLAPVYHGPWMGGVAVVGLVAMMASAIRYRRPAPKVLVVTLGFPVAFSLAYAALTTHAKANNYLLVAPFSALAAAWLLLEGWARVGAVGRAPRRAAQAAGAALLVWLVGGTSLQLYRHVVPTTQAVLATRLRPLLEPVALRVIYQEGGTPHVGVVSFRDRAATVGLDGPEPVSRDRLRLGDVEIFPADRLRGETAAAYRRRIEAAARVMRLRPRRLRVRGPELVAVLHPWRTAGEPLPIRLEPSGAAAGAASGEAWGTLQGELPELAPGTVVSLVVWVSRADRPPRLVIGSQELELHSTRLHGRRDRFVSERLRAAAAAPVRLWLAPETDLSLGARGGPQVALHRWQPQ